MAVNTGDFIRFEVFAEQYTQEVKTKLDFIVINAAALPIIDLLDMLIGTYRSWILGYLSSHLNVYKYVVSTYAPPIFAGGKVKHRFSETAEKTGLAGTDSGQSGGAPLPTLMAVSGSKVAGGTTWSINQASVTPVIVGLADTKFGGAWRVGGLTEAMTADAQGNKVSTIVDWHGTWVTALNRFVDLDRVIPPIVHLNMVVRSDYGPGGVIRVVGANSLVLFRKVTSITVGQFLGTQMTRKQTLRFQ